MSAVKGIMPGQVHAALGGTTGRIREDRVRRGFCDSEECAEDRRRRGLCDTCGLDPVKCYRIRLRMGGIIRDKVPLTIPGKVFNGVCLQCHPSMDPDGNKKTKRRALRASQPLPRVMKSYEGKKPRSSSASSASSVPKNGMQRQRGFLDLHKSVATNRPLAQSLDPEVIAQMLDEEEEEEEDDRVSEYTYAENVNIFNEKIVTRVPRVKKQSKSRSNPPLQDSPVQQHPRSPRSEEKVEDEASAHLNSPVVSHQQSPSQSCRNVVSGNNDNSDERPRQRRDRGDQLEEEKLPSLPSLLDNNDKKNASEPLDDESLDALAALCAQYCKTHPEDTVKFVPGGEIILPHAELCLPVMSDDLSVLTPATCFQGRGSLAEMFTSRRRQSVLTPIGEESSGALSERSSSKVSHEIREPAVPAQVAQHGTEAHSRDMGDYLESSSPHLLTLREIVKQCTQAGADDAAIETVTGALIHDNATSMSMELALFCLTTLWVLARRSDENKQKIIFDDSTFDAIIEAMQIYRERADIQNRACGVLWSLSMDPDDRKHVVQGGGCEAILKAVKAHPRDDELQVMALGAVKVLSFDDVGKSRLRSLKTSAVVADIMGRHVENPAVQSEGCVILGNLAADETNGYVAPVDERVVNAVVQGILFHPDSLEVHEAACFTLMGLASSEANVELIRRNGMTRVALEVAYQKHPEDVGNDIFTLLRRLKFDSFHR